MFRQSGTLTNPTERQADITAAASGNKTSQLALVSSTIDLVDVSAGLAEVQQLPLERAVTASSGVLCQFASDDRVLFTCDRAGRATVWDLRTRQAELHMSSFPSIGQPHISFAASCGDRILAAGTESASGQPPYLVFWDCRSPQQQLSGVYEDIHSDSVVSLSFHPSRANRLLSGSSDGLVCAVDLNRATEEKALQQTFNCEELTRLTGWLANQRRVFCLTTSEHGRIWQDEEDNRENTTLTVLPLPPRHPATRYLLSMIEAPWAVAKEALLLATTPDESSLLVSSSSRSSHQQQQLDFSDSSPYNVGGGWLPRGADGEEDLDCLDRGLGLHSVLVMRDGALAAVGSKAVYLAAWDEPI